MSYHSSKNTPRLVALLVVALLLCPLALRAQDAETLLLPDLSTPRATIGTFFEAMSAVKGGNDARLAEALACLYIGDDVPEADLIDRGTTAALRLFDILDQMQFSLDEIPDSPTSDTVEVALGTNGKGITLKLHRYEDAHWRINSETLQDDNLAQLEADLVADESEAGPSDGPLFDEPFKSVRATMRTFIRGMNETDGLTLEDAIKALDLSYVSTSIQADVGYDLAVQLKFVMDRIKLIEFSTLPTESERQPYVFHTELRGRIVLQAITSPEEDSRAWKFTKATLDSIDTLYYEYRDQPVVAGITSSALTFSFALRIRDWMHDHVSFLLNESFYLENWQWLGLFTIIFIGMAVSRAVSLLLVYLIRGWFRNKRFTIKTKLEKGFVKPIRIALMAWFWLLGLKVLGLPPDVFVWLRMAAFVVTALGVAWALYRLIDIMGDFLTQHAARTENKFDDLLVPILTKTLKVFIAAMALVAVAQFSGRDYSAVLAGLGLGGLAFALAAKDVIANIFGSITILLDRPFEIGDWVTIGSVDGTVETVGIRSTRIRTFYNSLITVPNAELTNATVDNLGKRRYRRIKTTLGIAYNTPVEKIEAFCEGIRELIRQHPYTRKDYFHVYLNDFSASSLDIMLYCFVETPEWSTELRERHRLLADILRLAQGLGVEFAFPTQTLHLHQHEASAPATDLPHSEALDRGQREAARIVREFLGGPGVIPPPVSFDLSDGSAAAHLDKPAGEEGESEGEL